MQHLLRAERATSFCVKGVSSSALLVCVSTYLFLWAGPSVGENPPSTVRPNEKVDTVENEKRAKAIVEGYYDALIAGRFAEAGTFIHSDTMGPIRTSLYERLKKAPPAQQSATLRELGLKNLTEYESLSTSQFFDAYARSNYGKALQVLSSPRVTTAVKIEKTVCRPEGGRCMVQFSLLITPKGEQTVVKNYQVEVIESKGRWVVGELSGSASKRNIVQKKTKAHSVKKTKGR